MPEFEILSSPFGDSTQQVQLLIKKAEISSNHGYSTIGAPKPVETRTRVISLLTELAELKRGREASTASGAEVDPNDKSQQVSPNHPTRRGVFTRNNPHSQEFMTQVHYSRVGQFDDDVIHITGLNMSPPVLPSPNDASRTIGTRPLLREKVSNPSTELVQLLPPNNIIDRTIHTRTRYSQSTPPNAKQPDTWDNSRVEEFSILTDGAPFNSQEETKTVEQGQGISIEPQTNNDMRSVLHEVNDEGVEEARDVKTAASPYSDTGSKHEQIHPRRASTGTAKAVDVIEPLGDSPSDSTSNKFPVQPKEANLKTPFQPLNGDPWQVSLYLIPKQNLY
jgi:hypothetical protein